MDGLPVLDLWDILIEILRSTNNNVQPNHNGIKGTCARPNSKTKTQLTKEDKKLIICLMWITYPLTHILLKVSLSCTFLEDNEAAINVIFKGRNPTMRHVSRTHKVALDWLFDRIKCNKHKIQIKYVDTKDQLADIPTKGSFTRDEWNHFLRLLHIMNFSMFSCSHFFLSNRKQSAMSKRGQEGIFRRRFGDGEVETFEFGDGEAETYEFGVAQLLEYEEEFSGRIERFQQPSEFQSGTRRCFNQRLETDSRHEAKSSRAFSSEATGRHSKMQIPGNRIREVILRTQQASGNRCEVCRHT